MLVRMTAKQIAGYLKAKKDYALSGGGVSFNDAYNKATYGITMDEYRAIDRAMHDAYGLAPKRTPAGVREALRLHGSSASRHHATKTSPAQLQREIDEALQYPSGRAAHATKKTGGKTMKIGDRFRSGKAWGEIVSVAPDVFEVAWDDELFTSRRFTKHARQIAPGRWEETRTGHATKRTKKPSNMAPSAAVALRRDLVQELLARGEEPSAQYAGQLNNAEIAELARGRGKLSGGRMSYSRRDLTEMADAIEAI
jgi:hypothetical protein